MICRPMPAAALFSSLASIVLLSGCVTDTAGADANAPSAGTTLAAVDGTARGNASVVQTADGLRVTVRAMGITPGEHAVHIHTVGVCAAPDFMSAGGHWNPTMRQHGMNNPQGMHMGDMPNMQVASDGTGVLEFTIAGAMISGGATPLLDADGASVVIHAGPDDMMSDPAGNAGGRIACGILTSS